MPEKFRFATRREYFLAIYSELAALSYYECNNVMMFMPYLGDGQGYDHCRGKDLRGFECSSHTFHCDSLQKQKNTKLKTRTGRASVPIPNKLYLILAEKQTCCEQSGGWKFLIEVLRCAQDDIIFDFRLEAGPHPQPLPQY